ncbi:MAG: MBL fold metallo-hydrolase [Candidatus Bathyarchaeaceae archaeon]
MLKKITVVPLAAESLGVRSMCTYVETSDVKVLLDAGASLAPNRFGYPPHPREYKAIAECRERISKAAEEADVVTLSHYHFDHHTPSYTDWLCNWSSEDIAKKIYEGKLVLVKSYRSMVNFSQRRRGWMFKKTGGSYAERLEIADGRTFEFGETKLRFSDPVFHGPENSALGWVLMTTIERGDERVLFASDVQGPMYSPTLDIILAERPQLVIMGGPPTYLAEFRVKNEHIQQGMQNLENLVRKVSTTILEHHTLRDEKWKTLSQPIFDAAAEMGHKVFTAAEFAGKENNLLEFRRRQLFESEPPSREFEKWMKLPQPKRKMEKPPV